MAVQLIDVDDVVAEIAAFCAMGTQSTMREVCGRWQQIVDDVREQTSDARWEASRVALTASGFPVGSNCDFEAAIITIGAGGTGIAGAGHFLERLCTNYGVSPDRTYSGEAASKVFVADKKGLARARSVFVDTADALVWPGREFLCSDGMRHIPPIARWSDVVGADNIISGGDDCGRLYPSAYRCKRIVENGVEVLRKQLEASTKTPTVLGFRSIAGASGAVLDAMLEIDNHLSAKSNVRKFDAIFFPDPSRDHYANVGAYNAVLSLAEVMENRELTFVFGNTELHGAMERAAGAGERRYDPHGHAEIAAHAMHSLVSPMLPHDPLNRGFAGLRDDHVPYPTLHYAAIAAAPLETRKHFLQRSDSLERLSCEELVTSVLSPSSLLSPGAYQGQLMSCGMHMHGNWTPREYNAAVAKLRAKRTLKFIGWSSSGIKCSNLTFSPLRSGNPSGILRANKDRDVTAVMNGTGVSCGFSQVIDAFDRNYSKRAFVHHFVAAGVEEADLVESAERLRSLVMDCEEVGMDGDDGEWDSGDEY